MKDNNTVSSEKHYRQINDVAADMGLSRKTIVRWGKKCDALCKVNHTLMVDLGKLNNYIERGGDNA